MKCNVGEAKKLNQAQKCLQTETSLTAGGTRRQLKMSVAS